MRKDFAGVHIGGPTDGVKIQTRIGKQKPENLERLCKAGLGNCQTTKSVANTQKSCPVHLKSFFSIDHL